MFELNLLEDVQRNAEQNNEPWPDILNCEWFGEKDERNNNWQRLAKGGDCDGEQCTIRLHHWQDEQNAHVANKREQKDKSVYFGIRVEVTIF